MKNIFHKLSPVLFAVLLFAALVSSNWAQSAASSIVRVFTIPDGVFFNVDDQSYQHATGTAWPVGSKHTLYALPVQDTVKTNARYVFKSWVVGSTQFTENPLTVTADGAASEFHAVFETQYKLMIRFYPCSDPLSCFSPGTVLFDGGIAAYDQDVYLTEGRSVTLHAIPGKGYVFAGWNSGPNQAIRGFENTVTMNGPITVSPRFEVARRINLATDPPGLQVLADRSPVPTPSTLEWGWNSVHSIGPVSPQQDTKGRYWVFSSWSDNGAPLHAYTVAPNSVLEDTLVATYVPAVSAAFLTSPPGFKINVDGRDSWPIYSFAWAVGETHRFEAPAQQVDDQGRVWVFQSWSNGGSAAQDFKVPEAAFDVGVRMVATYQAMGRLNLGASVAGVSLQVDGKACAAPCDVQRNQGTAVRVSAPAVVALGDGSRAEFQSWSDGSTGEHPVTLGAEPQSLTANYRVMNLLVTACEPAGGSAWQVQPASADGFYPAGSAVTVTALAQPGFRFRRWEGDLSGTGASGVVVMSAPRAVRAVLERAPYIAPAGIRNAAGDTPLEGVAPGSAISIFGASMAPDVAVGPESPLAQTLAGLTARIGDRLLPLFFVSPEQINAQLPPDLAAGSQVVTVRPEGQPEVRGSFTVVAEAPGLFPFAADGKAYAVVSRPDGSPVTPASPARVGELLTVFGTGFGPTDPGRPYGFAAPDSPRFNLLGAIDVLAGVAEARPVAAFAAPGRVGVDAVQFRLGESARGSGAVSLRVRVNGRESNSLLLPVE